MRGASLLLMLALVSPVAAHEFAPSYLELVEGEDATSVLFRRSLRVAQGSDIVPVLPCAAETTPHVLVEGVARVARWRLACDDLALAGAEISVRGLAESRTDALVHVSLRDGREVRHVLTPRAPSFVIPARERRADVFTSYLELGVVHLFTGLDHVLFVIGLVWLLGAQRRLLVAITCFTLGHSATLALASLGRVEVATAPVEIAIAASLVLLALEIARPDSGRSLLRRHPGGLTCAFGLLHGLGFAGALSEAGLPSHSIPLALLSFNAGIELGQLAVALLAALAVLWMTRSLQREGAAATRLQELPATALGGVGVYLGLTRAVPWLGL